MIDDDLIHFELKDFKACIGDHFSLSNYPITIKSITKSTISITILNSEIGKNFNYVEFYLLSKNLKPISSEKFKRLCKDHIDLVDDIPSVVTSALVEIEKNI